MYNSNHKVLNAIFQEYSFYYEEILYKIVKASRNKKNDNAQNEKKNGKERKESLILKLNKTIDQNIREEYFHWLL
jgi:hypothetical protein